MSWHYLQEQEVASWEEGSSDGPPSALWRLIATPDPFFSQDNEMGSWKDSRSGMTWQHSKEPDGEGGLISYREDSRVRTSLPAEQEKGSVVRVQGYGLTWPELSLRFCPSSYSWKIHPCLLPGDWTASSPTLPQWGTMRHGELSGLTTSVQEPDKREIVSGYWPTLQANHPRSGMANTGDVNQVRSLVDTGEVSYLDALAITKGQIHRKDLPPWREEEHRLHIAEHGKRYSGRDMGRLCPRFGEVLMGWPIGWTDLGHLETDRFLRWLLSHSPSCTDS